jgi:CheY-like chemotaxis protein
VGTTVSIEVPLSRVDPGQAAVSPASTPKPAEAANLSLPGEKLSVGFIGFQADDRVRSHVFEGRDGAIKENIKKSVSNCMVDWLQMEPYPDLDGQIHRADYVVILVDERITEFIQPYVEDVSRQQPRVIALLASEMSRREVENVLGQSIHAFEVMSAPFGPRKMARAVAACEKAAADWQGHYRRPPPLTTIEMLKMVQSDIDVGSYLLESNGLVVRPKINNDHNLQRVQSTDATHLANTMQQPKEPPSSEAEEEAPPKPASSSHTTRSLTASNPHQPRNSRLLLVDDNVVNLRLLETFMRKRKHDYTCAENGLIAVEAFEGAQREKESQGRCYGIIFMDISMPVMDGLEATREIRKLERKQREEYEKQENNNDSDDKEIPASPVPTPALIVALTGLANGQDQANAFASGVDLFMTKPVKFKEIGRLLDDWFRQKDVGHSAGVGKT